MSHERQERIDLFKHMNETNVGLGQSFFRSCILINGGAAVAILGFVASIARADDSYSGMITGVATALMFFAWGLMAAMAGIGCSYFMGAFAINSLSASSSGIKRCLTIANSVFHVLAIAAAVAAAVCFLRGAWAVKAAVLSGFS